jgi:Tfp pilus assembly protein PilO
MKEAVVPTKNRQQLLAVIAITAVALLAADRLIRAPLYSSWLRAGSEIALLRKQVAEGKSWIQRESSLRSRWQTMSGSALPNNPSTTEQKVLKALDRWCRDSGIKRDSFTPQWKHDSDNYTTLECRIEASGKLSSVTRFLYEIEKDPMALRLENVELSTRDNEGQLLALGLQISALVLNPQEKR